MRGQATLTAGDTLDFETTVDDFPASAGYSLVYRLVPSGWTGAAIEFTANATDPYRVQLGPAVTAVWAPGNYWWYAIITKTGERYADLDDGAVTIRPDPQTVASYDGRTVARKLLDQCEAALLAWTTNHVAEYEINGRRMKYADRADVLAMRSRLKAEVWRETAAEQMANGGPNPRMVRVRFGRA